MRRNYVDDFESHRELLERLSDEADRQLASSTARGAAMSSRATVLLASSSLSGAIQAAVVSPSIWRTTAAVFAILAALSGLRVLLMRKGIEVGIDEVKNTAWNQSPAEGLHTLIYRKLDVIKGDEKALHTRHRWLLIGFACLTISLILTAVGIFVPLQ